MTRPVQCIDEQSLGEVLALPASDPRRAHLDECPRCRALAVSYRQFLEPAAEEKHAYGTEEDERMTSFRERMFGGAAAAGVTAGGKEPLTELDPPANAPWWQKMFAPVMRPIWGFGIVIIAFGVLRLAPRPEPQQITPALRGAGTHAIVPAAPNYLPDGGVTLSWPNKAEADRFELRFYSTALAEIGRRDVGLDTLVNVAIADLPEAYRNGEAVLYRVVAIQNGDDLETSAPGSLKKP